ncbi:MAG TPA: YdeI/OmpD-associated family protein [Pyrinomonadaceae bacterium]|nr:YdeI/OmpD-associated family protein [Pyrinomonadaceae bacterium]
MATTKRFRVLLEQYEGTNATGINIPFDVEKVFGTRARVPVRGTVNGFPFRSSVFPKGDGTHYMVVNKETRAGAKAKGGETISVVMERDDEPRTIEPPAELARALKGNKEARAAWEKLSFSHRKEYARSVEEARRPETRQRRVEKAISELTERTRRANQ